MESLQYYYYQEPYYIFINKTILFYKILININIYNAINKNNLQCF